MLFVLTSCKEKASQIEKSGDAVTIGILISAKDTSLKKRMKVLKALIKERGYLDNGDEIKFKPISLQDNFAEDFTKACEEENFISIISFLTSPDTLSLLDQIKACQTPVIATIATYSSLNKEEYISRICLNNEIQAHVAASYLRDELFIPEVSVLSDRKNEFSLELSSFFIKRYAKLGGSIELLIDTKEILEDPKGVVGKLKEEETDTLYLSIDAEKTRYFLKLIEKEKMKFKILAHDGLFSAFKERYPQDISMLDGVFVVDNYADTTVLDKKLKPFFQSFKDTGVDIDTYDLLSYDAVNLLRSGLNTCAKEDKVCLNAYLRNAQNIEGAVEKISMEDGNAYRAVYVNEIKGSQMHLKVRVY